MTKLINHIIISFLFLAVACDYEVVPDETGTTNSGTITFNISPGPYYENCTTIQFSNIVDDVVSLTWDFGDNNISTEQNASHIYEKAGTYTVKLTVNTGEFEFFGSKNITIDPTNTFDELSTPEVEYYKDLIVEADGSYVLAGMLKSDIREDLYFEKRDKNGSINLSRPYETPDYHESAIALFPSNDGGYIIISRAVELARHPVWVVQVTKTFADGEIDRSFLMEEFSDYYATAATKTSDGGLAIAGKKPNKTTQYDEIFCIKLNKDLGFEWRNSYEDENVRFALANSIIQTKEGDLLIAGFYDGLYDPTYPHHYNCALKVNGANGDLLWKYGEPSYRESSSAFSSIIDQNGNYIIIGYSQQFEREKETPNAILTKLRGSDGFKLDSKTIRNNGYINSIVEVPGNGFAVLGGIVEVDQTFARDYLLVNNNSGLFITMLDYNLNQTGNNPLNATYTNTIKTTDNCGFVIVGAKQNGNATNGCVIKTDAQGNIN